MVAVFWQVGAPRSPFGKFWTMDGHSMIRVDGISEQRSVSTSEVGDLARRFGKKVWQEGLARRFGKKVWQMDMANGYGNRILQ